MATKYKNPPIWAKFGFQVDYDVANWYPNFTGMLSTMSRCADNFRNFQNSRHCHGNHKKNISCYVLTLFFIHTTSTCIVRLGDICNTLRYSNQYFIFTFAKISHTIYAAKFEQTIIHQHVHLRRKSQSHSPAHVRMRLYHR